MSDMTQSRVRHDSFKFRPLTLGAFVMSPRMPAYTWCDAFMYVMLCKTWLIHLCDMTRALSNGAFAFSPNVCICVTWRIHMCTATPQYVWRGVFIGVTWLIHMCDMTHLNLVHWLTARLRSRISFLHMCEVTHSYVWRFTHSHVHCKKLLQHTPHVGYELA